MEGYRISKNWLIIKLTQMIPSGQWRSSNYVPTSTRAMNSGTMTNRHHPASTRSDWDCPSSTWRVDSHDNHRRALRSEFTISESLGCFPRLPKADQVRSFGRNPR
jgi:hypothetical protein